MKLIVLLIFCVLIYLEFSVFVWIANQTSVLTALLLGLLTTFGGIGLVRRQGVANFKNFQNRMHNQENRSFETINTFFILFAGFLLLVPGFITDGLGLFLLIPPVQKILYAKLKTRVKFYSHFYTKKGFHDDVIDGEFYKKEDGQGQLSHKEDKND